MRALKAVGTALLVLVVLLFSIATCSSLRVMDPETKTMLTLGEAAIGRLSQALANRANLSQSRPQYALYQHPDVSVTFHYPDFLVPSTDIQKDRAPSGIVRRLEQVEMSSSNPVVGLLVRVNEDAELTSEPDWYPPDPELLRTYASLNLGQLSVPDTDENTRAATEAVRAATTTTISGYPALTFSYGASGSPVGHIYVRGGIMISPNHLIELFVFGSDESGVLGSVSREYVDTVWVELESSFRLSD